MSSSPVRVALHLPTGWRATHHELLTLDPEQLAPGSPDWLALGEDLLQVTNETGDIILDVGWWPDSAPEGAYALRVVRDREWNAPLVYWKTRSLSELLARIQDQMEKLARSFPAEPMEALVAQLGDPHPAMRAEAARRLVWREAIEAMPAVKEACAVEMHRPTELKLQEAIEALARARARRAR